MRSKYRKFKTPIYQNIENTNTEIITSKIQNAENA